MKALIIELWAEGWAGRLILFFTLFALAIIPLAVIAIAEDARQWESFKAAHNCKMVAVTKGATSTGIMPINGGNGSVGVIFIAEPDKKAWLCDDGVTYWR